MDRSVFLWKMNRTINSRNNGQVHYCRQNEPDRYYCQNGSMFFFFSRRLNRSIFLWRMSRSIILVRMDWSITLIKMDQTNFSKKQIDPFWRELRTGPLIKTKAKTFWSMIQNISSDRKKSIYSISNLVKKKLKQIDIHERRNQISKSMEIRFFFFFLFKFENIDSDYK